MPNSPWRLFQFRRVNEYLWQQLELSEFYCCSPSQLNDPFDCRLEWTTSIGRALSDQRVDKNRRVTLASMQKAFSDRDPRLDAGICCFSVFAGHDLMWSHYAEAHCGVCLMYEIPADYFSRKYPATPSGGQSAFYFVGASQIVYGDNAFFDWLVTGDLNQPVAERPIENAVSRIFTSKAMAWSYEEEFRIVTSRPGGLAFDPAFLKQMIFGLAVSERSKRLLTGIALRNNCSTVILSAVRSATSDFGLEFSEL